MQAARRRWRVNVFISALDGSASRGFQVGALRVAVSFDGDEITHHPEFELFKLLLPPLLEPLHPLPVLGRVGYVYDEAHEVVAVHDRAVTSVPFDALGFITGGAELFDDLQNRLSQPFARDVAAVVELEREQHLESPPPAAHRSPSPLR